ncbi:hypothetical protein K461DRAFT_298371 [Myriangium duriaei CBS 260.36]|uniref:Uncharacterized protein n=1 Tax=Myriangium duriaei CBS 260.36 TaxID=1168546 RepID=A0A9P4IPK8_9PEZI|nr:hypothetical protein K461DRAFT_298371 [Myriangium duriaei CBS 260.36]
MTSSGRMGALTIPQLCAEAELTLAMQRVFTDQEPTIGGHNIPEDNLPRLSAALKKWYKAFAPDETMADALYQQLVDLAGGDIDRVVRGNDLASQSLQSNRTKMWINQFYANSRLFADVREAQRGGVGVPDQGTAPNVQADEHPLQAANAGQGQNVYEGHGEIDPVSLRPAKRSRLQ